MIAVHGATVGDWLGAVWAWLRDGFPIPLGDVVSDGIDWFKDSAEGFLDLVSTIVKWLVVGLGDALIAVPFGAMILILVLLGWLLRSWQFALGTLAIMLLIFSFGQWNNAMLTLALVLVAALIAIVIAVPFGILAARNDTFSAIIKPVLDFMQTMPAFVYLIPAVVFFSVGYVPGVFATVLFSLAPGVRFTELGIRGVDPETVEAGHAFGATPGKILRGIQLPLATPTIMAGINQVIMLALSMAVIAGMAGGDGLGKEVVRGVTTLDISLGVEAGISVVFLAIYLDRVTAALGDPASYRRSLIAIVRRKRHARSTAGDTRTAAAPEAPAATQTAARPVAAAGD